MSNDTLGQYGITFQKRTLQALLLDHNWSEQMAEVFDPTYFDQKHLQYLSQRYLEFHKKYKSFPSIQMLVTIISDELKKGSDLVLKDQVVNYLVEVKSNPSPGDLEFVKEKSLDFCRKQALKLAMGQAVDCIASNDGNYDQIVEIVKKAVMVGTTPSVGHDFFEDTEARFAVTQRNVIPTGLKQIDELLQGGAGKGELNCVVAASGTGKSHFLVAMGAEALKHGFDVVHYTLELSETQTGLRYDSYLCDIDSNEIVNNKEKVLARYKDSTMGRLFIKQYPPNSATVFTLRSHIDRLKIQKRLNPSLIIIDYADIMRSTRKYDALRHELKLAYEEIRALAVELGVTVWTASQSNREGADKDVIDMTNMSEAYGKAMVADFIISLSRRAEEKSTGSGRMYIAKNRAGKDGILYPMMVDTAKSKFTITSGSIDLENHRREEKDFAATQFKTNLAKRVEELKDSGVLK